MEKSEPRSHVKHDINVTPLADVMLVLLIIFMVITPMLGPGVEVRVPEADYATAHPDKDDSLVVALKGDRTIFINEADVTEDDLLPELTSLMEARADKTLFVKANEFLDYGWVLEKMDLCRRAGALEIALITRTKQ